jgi:hypothetical protein
MLQAKDDYDTEFNASCSSASMMQAKTDDCDAKKQLWSWKNSNCSVEWQTREVAICAFGDKLANKCQKSSEYPAFIEEVETLNGNQYSDPDRQSEYHAIELVKCMLTKYVTDGRDTIDSTTMTECLAGGMTSYANGIGILDKMKAEYDAQMTAARFTCQENNFTFDGGTWIIHDSVDAQGNAVTPPYSVNYEYVTPHAEPVVDITGTTNEVFATCATVR